MYRHPLLSDRKKSDGYKKVSNFGWGLGKGEELKRDTISDRRREMASERKGGIEGERKGPNELAGNEGDKKRRITSNSPPLELEPYAGTPPLRRPAQEEIVAKGAGGKRKSDPNAIADRSGLHLKNHRVSPQLLGAKGGPWSVISLLGGGGWGVCWGGGFLGGVGFLCLGGCEVVVCCCFWCLGGGACGGGVFGWSV